VLLRSGREATSVAAAAGGCEKDGCGPLVVVAPHGEELLDIGRLELHKTSGRNGSAVLQLADEIRPKIIRKGGA
jgi:hypothetical protein